MQAKEILLLSENSQLIKKSENSLFSLRSGLIKLGGLGSHKATNKNCWHNTATVNQG